MTILSEDCLKQYQISLKSENIKNKFEEFSALEYCHQQKVLQQVWLDKLTSANCKAKLQFRAGQTSSNFKS